MKKVLALIPARFGSTRFPGKPLADLGGKPMIQRVYEQVKSCSAISEVLVATDHEGIFSAVLAFGGKVIMTSENCLTGTDRCAEALKVLGEGWDVLLNVQGDEPFIRAEQLQELLACMESPEADIGTLVRRISKEQDLFNPNVVKAVLGQSGKALYFSRHPIPFVRGEENEKWIEKADFYRHVGLYAFRPDVLKKLSVLPPGKLEMAESLEQLRWLEAGYSIVCAETAYESPGIDTPEDLAQALTLLKD